MPKSSGLSSWLLKKLDAKNISVEDLARQAGLSRTSVYYYLDDHTRPTKASMERICKVLDTPVEEALALYVSRQRGRPPGTK